MNKIDLSLFSNKLILTDLDGTLADITHRQKFLINKPRNWNAFLRAEEKLKDLPFDDVIWLINLLYTVGNTVLVATGRSETERPESEKWLKRHGVLYHEMFMRENGDYRDDSIVKKEMLDHIRDKYGEPFMVFDDRDRVVKMWRENGVRCMQVAYGDF